MAAKAKKRLSSKLVSQVLEDLCKRQQKQTDIADALEAAARPHGDVTVAAYPMLKVLELAAGQHAQGLRQVTGFAQIIRDRQAGR
jgi:hypothetical protein